MKLDFEIDLGEFLRNGARITLQPLVHFVNEKLQDQFGSKWIEVASYIYSNSDGSNRSLKVRDNRIHWDLYNITTFITISSKKQKINEEGETINFRESLFGDLRDDMFDQLQLLRTIRNITSHAVYDGEKEIGYLEAHDVETYLRLMLYIIPHFSNENIYKIRLENIIKNFNEKVVFLSDVQLQNKIKNSERKLLELFANKEIDKINISSINMLKDVKLEKKKYKGRKTKQEFEYTNIVLMFDDNSQDRYMFESGVILSLKMMDLIYNKAKKYLNNLVITTSLGEWNPQKYFNNIYLITKNTNGTYECEIDQEEEKKLFTQSLKIHKGVYKDIKSAIDEIKQKFPDKEKEIVEYFANWTDDVFTTSIKNDKGGQFEFLEENKSKLLKDWSKKIPKTRSPSKSKTNKGKVIKFKPRKKN